MQRTIQTLANQWMEQKYRRRRWKKILRVLACIVVFVTTYALIMPAITLEKTPICKMEEHEHGKNCYEKKLICKLTEEKTDGHTHTEGCRETERTLVCQTPEMEGHTHTEECMQTERILVCALPEDETHTHEDACYAEEERQICELEEQEGHVHNESCYEETEVLICGQEETPAKGHTHDESCYKEKLVCGRDEHQHDADCYETSDENADVESASGWERTLPERLSGNWAEDVLAVAKSQIGYTESTANYITEEGRKKGYSRYGAWYGDPYGDWCAMFVSFCLYYADIPETAIPYEASCPQWLTRLRQKGMYQNAGGYTPVSGDLIFFDWDQDGTSDHVGLVKQAADGGIGTIEGNAGDCVQEMAYALTDGRIMGYGVLPENPAKKTPAIYANTFSAARDFAGWITEVTVQHRPNAWENGGKWQDVADNTVNQNEELRFSIAYQVPGYQVTKDNPTITYQLPSNITISTGSGGTFTNDAGIEAGTYYIDTNGLVTVTFNDFFIKESQNGQAITGFVAFEAKADETLVKDDKISIDFRDDLHVTLDVEKGEGEKADLKVSKTASAVDSKNGTVSYTITVNSEHGTGKEVSLQDVMEGVVLQGGFRVTDKNGNPVDIPAPAPGSSGFDLTLPQMGAGDSYTITYMAELAEASGSEGKTAKNRVEVSSESSEGKKLKDDANVETVFEKKVLGKTGKDNGDGTISWTVTVNQSGTDISGRTLIDQLDGKPFEGNVSIDPATADGKTEIKLPYTFPEGSHETYTITYTTPADKLLGAWEVKNKIFLSPKGTTSTENTDAAESGVNNGKQHQPLRKEAVEPNGIGENGASVIRWKVTIDAEEGDIPGPWTYEDKLEGDQWYTPKQINDIQNAVNLALHASGISMPAEVKVTGTPETEKGYQGFQITFRNGLKKGQKFEFIYESTVQRGDGSERETYKNNAKIKQDEKEVTASAEVNHFPAVEKYDRYDPDSEKKGADTGHTYEETKGILKWGIKTRIPKGCRGRVTITEKLPEGVTLKDHKCKLNLEGSGEFELIFDEAGYAEKAVWDGGANRIVTARERENGEIVIEIPEELTVMMQEKTIRLEIDALIQDGALAPIPDSEELAGTFRNEVVVQSTDQGELGTGVQTQTIKKEAEKFVQKSHTVTGADSSGQSYENNIIPYSIVINPDGRDLLEGADELTLTDIMEYNRGDAAYPCSAALVPKSVHVYYRNPDGSKGAELAAEDSNYVYERILDENPCKCVITLTVPDGTPLIMEYQYKISAEAGTYWNIKNTAKLEGTADSRGEDQNNTSIKIVQSAAGANTDGVTIYKVDAEDTGKGLAGAEFQLYRYDETEDCYVLVQNGAAGNIYQTGENGLLQIKGLAYNRAYKLMEVKAPEGYEISREAYEFSIGNADTKKYPIVKPADFSGITHAAGDVIFYPNQSQTTRIEVKKKWFSHNGQDITGTKGGSVAFELYRKEQVQTGGDKPDKATVNINISGLLNETRELKIGAVIRLTYVNTYRWNDGGSITKDGEACEPVSVEEEKRQIDEWMTETKKTRVYEFEVTGDMNIGGWVSGETRTYALDVTGNDSDPEPEDLLIGTYHLRYTDGWKWVSEDLPRSGVSAAGKSVAYTYYVKEIQTPNCNTGYDNNEGIQAGTITINNTEAETPSVALPETGGGGTKPYTTSGLLFMMLSLTLLYRKNKRRKEERASS